MADLVRSPYEKRRDIRCHTMQAGHASVPAGFPPHEQDMFTAVLSAFARR